MKSAALWPRKTMGCWCASAFPLACGRKGRTAIHRRRTRVTLVPPDWCAQAMTTIGAVGSATRALRRSAPRVFSARISNLSPHACRPARSRGAPRASSASGSRREPRYVRTCMVPTVSKLLAPRAAVAGCSRRQSTQARRGWNVLSGAAKNCPHAAQGRSATCGSACRTATRRASLCAATAFGAGRAGQTAPWRAARIGSRAVREQQHPVPGGRSHPPR